MSSILGQLYYEITGDTTKLNKNIDASKKELKGLSIQLENTGETIKKFAKGTITAVLIKSLLDASSRVEELGNKFDVVFSSIAAETNQWIKEYSKATNRGITVTKEFLANQQDIQTGFGDSTEHAAAFSKALLGFTNDLASFTNTSVEDTSQAINSILAGQFEAGRRLGLGLSVAVINQSEYTKQLGKTWDEMSNLEKREAVLSVALSQSKNAIRQNVTSWEEYNYKLGDAVRTSDSYANVSQGLKQSLIDLKAEVGNSLLPFATSVSNAFLTLIRDFNNLNDVSQSLIVSLATVGASMAMIGGPIGIAVGALSSLIILSSNQKTTMDKLKDSTNSLMQSSSNYSIVLNQLKDGTKNLSNEEKILLDSKLALAKLDNEKALKDLSNSYADCVKAIEEYGEKYKRAQAEFSASTFSKGKSREEIKAEIDSLTGDLDTYQKAYKFALEEIYGYYNTFNKKADKIIEQSGENANEAFLEYQENSIELEQSLKNIAISYKKGYLDIEIYKIINKELYDEIIKVADGIDLTTTSVEENSEVSNTATEISKKWTTALKEQQAELAKESADFNKYKTLKLDLLKDEEEAEIRELASKSNLFKAEEDLNKLSIEDIKERLSASEEYNTELLSLEEYYGNERLSLASEVAEELQKIEDEKKSNITETQRLLSDQLREEREGQIKSLENEHNYQEALKLRLSLLHEERDENLKEMENKISRGEATEEALNNIRLYYANEEKKITEETSKSEIAWAEEVQKAKQDALEESKKEVQTLVDNYKKSLDERRASELEADGLILKATTLRINLLHQERDEEIAYFEEKLKEGKATEEELYQIKLLYANKEDNLRKTQNEKLKEKIVDTLDEIMSFTTEFISKINDIFASKTEARIQQIEEEKNATLKALGLEEETELEKLQKEYTAAVKAGDMELAREKEKEIQITQIEEESEEKKKKLQREQAIRDKKLSIFQATIDTLSAVIKYLSNPGGWAGIGLSAMAAATGSAQIAAISAQPLPSYDVGAIDVSEDHIAQIHQGEMIIPKTFAEGVRNGSITVGKENEKNKVQITIINNTSSEITTEKRERDGMEEITLTIGKVVDSGIIQGRFDKSLKERFNINRRNQRG